MVNCHLPCSFLTHQLHSTTRSLVEFKVLVHFLHPLFAPSLSYQQEAIHFLGILHFLICSNNSFFIFANRITYGYQTIEILKFKRKYQSHDSRILRTYQKFQQNVFFQHTYAHLNEKLVQTFSMKSHESNFSIVIEMVQSIHI
jgi:hypothetical protein